RRCPSPQARSRQAGDTSDTETTDESVLSVESFASRLERRGITGADPDHLGRAGGEVHDGGRLESAVASVDHRIDHVVELVLDLPTLGHRVLVTWQQHGARQHRLAELP